MGGSKTELKLLACQHNDQTWSSVPTEEVISWEDNQLLVGEGALLLLNLGNNRQIQGTPELAGSELVRQLQKISRLMEKSKDEQDKIEQWKQSLQYQSQELTRREMEIEGRLEQIEQMEEEFEYLERQKKELDEIRDSLQKEQAVLNETKSQFGLSVSLKPAQASQIESLINRLVSGDDNTSPWRQTSLVLEAVQGQRTQLITYWQKLEQKRAQMEQRQREADQQQQEINKKNQELESAKISLEQARVQFQVQQTILNHKKELLGRINLDLQTLESLQETLSNIAHGGEDNVSSKIDIAALEKMPLGELEEAVRSLQHDLDRLVRFVNEQEEELTLQAQAVDELQAKLTTVSEFERSSIEEELKDEQERRKMLDKTLGGQRRTLWERQEVLLLHLRILRRRQGILESDQQRQVNIEPMLHQLEEQENNFLQEKQKLEAEIEHLQNNLQKIKEMIDEQNLEHHHQVIELEHKEKQWQQTKFELTSLQSQLKTYEEILDPLQDHLNNVSQNLQELAQWFNLGQ